MRPNERGHGLPAYGIDLGTTRSGIACVNAYGKPELIDNVIGERLTPSVVWAGREGIVVGKHAKEMAGGYPDQVAQFFKRKMHLPHWRWTSGGAGTYSAVQLSAEVLQSLAGDVGRATGTVAQEVVIAVPAYFGHVARSATYEAGARAGLTVIDLINEPTAAVLAWMMETGQRPRAGLLVYDLGGGTFDSVAVRIGQDSLDVVTIGGDNSLGGHDWDRALTLYFNEVFQTHFGLTDVPTATKETDAAWLDKAEYAKIFLASNPADSVQVVLSHGGQILPVTVTREKYDRLTDSLRQRPQVTSGWVLHDARINDGLAPEQVLLAGGMSRLPAIKDLLQVRLGLTPAPMSRPDYMVAEGAAIWALKRSAEKRLGTDNATEIARYLIRESGMHSDFAEMLARLRVRHVTSKGFAIQYRERATNRLRLEFLAHAQQELPVPGHWSGATKTANQNSVEVAVYEQNGRRETTNPQDHTRIGAARMENIPFGYPAGTPIEVTLTLDHDQVIRVSFTHPGMSEAAQANIYVGQPSEMGEG